MVEARLCCEFDHRTLSFLILCACLLSSGNALPSPKENCHGVKTGAECKFPFFYNGRMYFECTTEGPGTTNFNIVNRCPTRLINASFEATNDISDWEECSSSCSLQKYTSNQDIEKRLITLSKEYSHLVKLISIGQSARGQNLVGVQMSRNVHQPREWLKPKVRYIGNMHGNEPVGRELLLHLAEVLAQGYGVHENYTRLLDLTDVTIIPTINPDGFDRSTEGACLGADYETGRFNEGNIDLNRDFPTWREINDDFSTRLDARQPETQAVMKFIENEPFVLSANIHGGAVVASYPWDDYRFPGQVGTLHRTPDHDVFSHLAHVYADNHQTMQDHSKCTRWYFKDGVTNGAEWYELVGGLQDYNYLFTNDFEITLEVSCCKYPKRQLLNRLWEDNRDSILMYLEQVHRGIKGLVSLGATSEVKSRDQLSENRNELPFNFPMKRVKIVVEDLVADQPNRIWQKRDKDVHCSNTGEYWRMLLPGTYRVRAELENCHQDSKLYFSAWNEVTITEDQKLVNLNMALTQMEDCAGPR